MLLRVCPAILAMLVTIGCAEPHKLRENGPDEASLLPPPHQCIYSKCPNDAAFIVKNATIHDAVRALADQYDVHVGAIFRLQDGAYFSPQADRIIRRDIYLPCDGAGGGTLATAVQVICEMYEGYRYEVETDVVNIYPIESTPFELRLDVLSNELGGNILGYWKIMEALSAKYGIDFGAHLMGGEGIGIVGRGWYTRRRNEAWDYNQSDKSSVHVRNRTARELLNMYVRATPYDCWVAQAATSGVVIDHETGEERYGTAYVITHFDYNTFDSAPDDEVLEAFLAGKHGVFEQWTVREEFRKRLPRLIDDYLNQLTAKPTDHWVQQFSSLLSYLAGWEPDKIIELSQAQRERMVETAIHFFDRWVEWTRRERIVWAIKVYDTEAGAQFLRNLPAETNKKEATGVDGE